MAHAHGKNIKLITSGEGGCGCGGGHEKWFVVIVPEEEGAT